MAVFCCSKCQAVDSVKLADYLNYIRDPLATSPELTYSTYVSCRFPYEEMMFVKECYASALQRTWQGRQFFDYIVSLPEEESKRLEQFAACMVAINQCIANFNSGHYQTIHAIHVNTDNLHAHIVANNIDIFTGARFDLDMRAFYEMREGVNAILQEYGFTGLREKKNAA